MPQTYAEMTPATKARFLQAKRAWYHRRDNAKRHAVYCNKEKVMNHQFTAPNSQIVRKVWYNPDTRILSVQLVDKNTKKHLTKKDRTNGYLYVGVPQPVFDQFARAKSKGKFFVHNIKPHYPAQLDVFCAANSIG